jgi:hypothetical protein
VREGQRTERDRPDADADRTDAHRLVARQDRDGRERDLDECRPWDMGEYFRG